MTSPDQHPSFSFHIESGESFAGDSLPASILVQILQNAQQVFSLIGVFIEGRSIKNRARVSTKTIERFQLVCQLPRSGCFAVPVTVGGTDDLIQLEYADRALEIFQRLMAHISNQTVEGLSETLPDEQIRRRVLEHIKAMAPRAGAKWTLSLHDQHDLVFAFINQDTIPFVQATLVPEEQREASRVVTGELKNIDFIERKLTIIYPPTNKELVCIYDEALEDLLYERRRELIQVTGQVLLDAQGEPKQIIDVTDIHDLDLTPFEIGSIEFASLRLLINPTLILDLTLDDSKQLICASEEDLGISVFAPTREALLFELSEQVSMLWLEYVKAKDAELDGPALKMKMALASRLTEVVDAA